MHYLKCNDGLVIGEYIGHFASINVLSTSILMATTSVDMETETLEM